MGLLESPKEILACTADHHDCFDGSTDRVYAGLSGGSFYLLNFLGTMTLKNQARLVAINAIVFLSLLTLIDIFLGDWFKKKPPVSNLPDATWDKKIVFDATKITGDSDVLYTVDAKGYRGFTDFSKDNIVLTIGGSTTEQLFVGDGKTWQDILRSQFNNRYQFVNGGIGGQSTFGHLYAIDKWHTKELKPAQVKAVIFYFGINDISLLQSKSNPNESPKANIYQFKMLLARNSFFYQRLKLLKENIIASMNNATNKNAVWVGHDRRSQSFVDNRPPQLITQPERPKYAYYKSLISNLVTTTRHYFPSAKIIFVQQQIPGCMFQNPFTVIDRHPVSTEDTSAWCKALGKVYLLQDKEVASLPKSDQPKILKMYLHQHISDDGVYDYTHTNELGSSEIARYLRDNLPL